MKEGSLVFKTIRIVGGQKEMLFLHGFGGNLDQPGVKWTMERFKEAGYTVTYVQLPTVISDFNNDILRPIKDVQERLGPHVIVGFSLGGLAATYLERSIKNVYLSPFWGINDRWGIKGIGGVLRVLAGFNAPSLKRRFDLEDAGPMAVKDDLRGIPEMVDPRTIHEMHTAQVNMPDPDPNDVVFYCPKDAVISIKAIEARTIEKHTFKGGHMFYLSRDRKEIMKEVIRILDISLDHNHSES